MKTWWKKLIVILPVIVVSVFYLRVIYHESYGHAGSKRIIGFMLSVVFFYTCVFYLTLKRKQEDFFPVLVQSSFFVYVFFVLQLTGYFILLKEVSSHGWWDKMDHRIETNEHVNFIPFNTINRYDTFDKQVAGNFIMLFPLGIYLPLLYRRLRKFSGFPAVLLISLLASVGIEILQLATNSRSTDVDDIMLNTMGAGTGFVIYQLLKMVLTPQVKSQQ